MDVRRTGRIFGWFFIGTFVTSIVARLLFIDGLGASWQHVRFVPGAGDPDKIQLAALFEFGLIFFNIATAVVIYPLVRRQSETVSLGYVAARIMESVFAAIGILSIMAATNVMDTLVRVSGPHATAYIASGNSLVKVYEMGFLFGPGGVVGIGNGLLLGYLMYRSELMPPKLALLGLIGGPLLFLSFILQVLGTYKNGSGPSSLLALPEIAWELSICIYCAWKGFRTQSPLAQQVAAAG